MCDLESRQKNKRMRIFTLAIVLTMSLSLVMSGIVSAYAVTQEEIAETERQSQEAQAAAEEAAEKAEEFMDKVKKAEEEIAVFQVKIDEAQAKIEDTQKKLEEKEAEVKKQNADLNQRLSAMYKTGTVGLIDVLLNSDNVSDLITNMGMVHRILNSDKELLEKLREDYDEIERLKEEQEDAKAELDSEMAQMEAKKAEFEELAEEYNRKMEEMAAEADRLAAEAQAKQEEYEEEIRRQREAAARAAAEAAARERAAAEGREATDEEIQEAIEEQISLISSTGYIWPVPSTYITQHFGYNPWAATHYSSGRHSGTDIGDMDVGTPIVAPCDGIVAQVDYARYGLGYYVALADGAHFVFFFGHMCQWPSVSVGQFVKQGEVLGYVGSTGYSTGPHLHYELRVDGVRTDVLTLYPDMF